MKTSVRIVLVCIFTLCLSVGLILTGCDSGANGSVNPQTDTRPDFIKGLPFGKTDVSNAISRVSSIESYLGVTDYGEGVYYFPYRGQIFGKALAKFLKEKSSVEVFSIAGDNDLIINWREIQGKYSEGAICRSGDSITTHAGYFVITRPKPQ